MLAALDNGVQGGRWYSLMDKVASPRTLAAAWKRVAANKGRQGGWDQHHALSGPRTILPGRGRAKLRAGSYRPPPVGACISRKGRGKPGPGDAAVKDRIVQTAITMVVEPIFEREFL